MPGSTSVERQKCFKKLAHALAKAPVRCKYKVPTALHREGNAWLFVEYIRASIEDEDEICTISKEASMKLVRGLAERLVNVGEGTVQEVIIDDGAVLHFWFQRGPI